MRLRWPLLWRQRPDDLKRLDRHPRLATLGERRIAIGRRAALHVAGQWHRQAEQAVFNGLAPVEQHLGLKVSRLWGNIEDAADSPDITGDIGAGGPPGPEGQRQRLPGRHDGVARLLQHRPGPEPHPIAAVAFGDEPPRIAEVGPVGRAEDAALDGRILQFCLAKVSLVGAGHGDRLAIAGEEHRLTVAEGGGGRKQAGGDGSVVVGWPRRLAGGDRLPEGCLGSIEGGRKLDAGEVEALGRLVEAVTDSVLRQPVGDVEQRQGQDVAKGLLILPPVEPAKGNAAGGQNGLAVSRRECCFEPRQQLLPLAIRQFSGIRGHLPVGHPVVHEGKPLAGGGRGQIKADAIEVKPALGRPLGMAVAAGVQHQLSHLCRCRGHATGRQHRQGNAQPAASWLSPAIHLPTRYCRTSLTMSAARITFGASRRQSASVSRGAIAVIQSEATGYSLASSTAAATQ